MIRKLFILIKFFSSVFLLIKLFFLKEKFGIIYIILLFASVGFHVAIADTLQTQIPGEMIGEFTSPLNLPEKFLFAFNYLIKTEAHISILGVEGQNVQTIDLLAEGVSIGGHKTFELKKGEYTVKEDFTVTGTPDSPFLQGQLLESKMSFDWKFTATDNGTYDFSITADAWDLKLNLTGDLTLQSIGETSASIPVELVTTRFIQAGEEIKYTAISTVELSKSSSFELISQSEEPVVTFVVTGVVRNEDGPVVPNASVSVTNEARNLSKITTTDEAGIYKVTFVGPQDSILAQTGDILKVTVGDIKLSYTLKEDDISQTRAVVNVLIEKLKLTSVAISPKTKFGVTEEITVTGTGSKGAKSASFSIAGVVEDILMQEKSSGTYLGNYIVKAGDNAENAVVTVTLTDAKGNVVTDSTKKVTLDTQIAITSVESSLTVVKNGDTITITVITEPKATVKADFLTLDSTISSSVKLSETSRGKYIAEVIISPDNTHENGVKEIIITATDALKNTTSQSLKVELKNPVDINQDGNVDILDLVLVGTNYGKQNISQGGDALAADVNGDKKVDILDLVLVSKNFKMK